MITHSRPETESAETWSEEALRDPAGGARQFGSPRKGVSPWERRVGTRIAEANSHAEIAEYAEGEAGPTPDGAFRVVTPRTCGGFAESGALDCGALRFEIADGGGSGGATPRSLSPAAVWATSLDGAPLAESRRILVAHVTDAANTGAVFDGPEARSWLEQGTTPALVRRGRAAVALQLAAAAGSGGGEPPGRCRVFRLAPTGARLAEIPASFDPATGRLFFTADTGYDSASATFFYEIVR